MRVRYSWENPVLGSAGGPRHALPLLVDQKPEDAGSFLLINGDTLTDMRLDDIVETHRASGALVTMALTRNPRPDVYGGVVVEHLRCDELSQVPVAHVSRALRQRLETEESLRPGIRPRCSS